MFRLFGNEINAADKKNKLIASKRRTIICRRKFKQYSFDQQKRGIKFSVMYLRDSRKPTETL